MTQAGSCFGEAASGTRHMSSVQNPGWLFYREDYTIHLSTYMGTVTSQYQDPCKPISIINGMSQGF